MMPPFIAVWLAKYGAALAGALLSLALTLALVFFAGVTHERAAWEARKAESFQTARNVERDANAIANAAESQALTTALAQKEKADAELTELRAQLALTPRCPVARATVRLLDGAPRVPAVAGTAALTGAAAPRVAGNTAATLAGTGNEDRSAETVDASEVLENCAWNRLNVAEPNAAQIEQLQAFYQRLRKAYNAP